AALRLCSSPSVLTIDNSSGTRSAGVGLFFLPKIPAAAGLASTASSNGTRTRRPRLIFKLPLSGEGPCPPRQLPGGAVASHSLASAARGARVPAKQRSAKEPLLPSLLRPLQLTRGIVHSAERGCA